MADYKELLRRAISALPENNGTARRAVYEKARSALVGQLRAITPPLPARDITQHRLQLEDCIRQVEQEASEAVISLGRDGPLLPRSERPVPPPSAPVPAVSEPPETPVPHQPVVAHEPPVLIEAVKSLEPIKPVAAGVSIEDIISAAAETGGATIAPVINPLSAPSAANLPPVALSVPRSGPTSPLPGSNVRPIDALVRGPGFEPRRADMPAAANSSGESVRIPGRHEPSGGNQAVARQPAVAPLIVPASLPVETALSSVREVELEAAPQPNPSEAQGAIARAIETLDREARGETTEAAPPAETPAETVPETAREAADRMFAAPKPANNDTEAGFSQPGTARRTGSGVTIFLIVFAVLLAGVGGAGFWAWREGYVDLDQMFGQGPEITETAAVTPSTTPTLDPAQPVETAPVVEGPGNTATTTDTPTTNTIEGLQDDERLEPTPEPTVPDGTQTVLPDISSNADPKSEERLPGQEATAQELADPTASVDPAALAGSQSLLLEASADGRTGAVPFSGTIEWTEGVDELGLPTIIGTASIPARNLGVEITIRKNSDPSLPASHLMEVNFDVNDTFIGGTIANLPGVLLKNAELVPGTPLVGASARVVGNSFLFALSAATTDTETNTDLLENRRWMDLAVIYGTGRNAIITLEKDDAAQTMFEDVFTAWAQ